MEKHLYKEHYDLQKKHWWFLAKQEIVVSLVDRYFYPRGKSLILDAGCGTGLMLKSLESFGDVKGMDYSEDAIKFCEIDFLGRVKRGWLPDNIPYKCEKFDLIVCLDVIEHIDDDIASLEALYKILSPGGTLILTVPALMSLWSRWDELNEHKRRYSLAELKGKLESANFKIEKLSYYNFLLFPMIFAIRTFQKVFSYESRASDTDMPGQTMNRILYHIFLFERWLLRRCNLPIGVSLISVSKKEFNVS